MNYYPRHATETETTDLSVLMAAALQALEAMKLIQGHCGDYVYESDFQKAIDNLESACATPPKKRAGTT